MVHDRGLYCNREKNNNTTHLISLSSKSDLLGGDLGRLSSRLGENRLNGLLGLPGLLGRIGLLALSGLLGLTGLLIRCGLLARTGLLARCGLLALSLSLQFCTSRGGVLSLERYTPGDLDRRLNGDLSLPPGIYASDVCGLLGLSRRGDRSRSLSNRGVSDLGERGRTEGRYDSPAPIFVTSPSPRGMYLWESVSGCAGRKRSVDTLVDTRSTWSRFSTCCQRRDSRSVRSLPARAVGRLGKFGVLGGLGMFGKLGFTGRFGIISLLLIAVFVSSMDIESWMSEFIVLCSCWTW